MWFISTSNNSNTNNLLPSTSLFYTKKYKTNNKCVYPLQKQEHIQRSSQRALNCNHSTKTDKPYSFLLMHHLRTKIRRKSSKYTFSSSSNGHAVHADSVLHAGHGRRRALGAGDRAASERVDWDFVAFPQPSSTSTNSTSGTNKGQKLATK